MVNKANRLLGLIKQTFLSLSEDSFLSLYKTLLRPILEYGNLVWGPNYEGDIEKVQQKTTRMVDSIRHLDHEEQLKALKLTNYPYQKTQSC